MGPSPVPSTHRVFGPAHPLVGPKAHPFVGKKMSLIKHKITTSANNCIQTALVQDMVQDIHYTSHGKEICQHGKRLKNYFKNQLNKLDLS